MKVVTQGKSSERIKRMRVPVLSATLVACFLLAKVLPVWGGEPPGLWLMPRHDGRNSGRASVATRMPAAPKEIWRYGGEAGAYSFVQKLREGDFLVQIGRGLERVAADGT